MPPGLVCIFTGLFVFEKKFHLVQTHCVPEDDLELL